MGENLWADMSAWLVNQIKAEMGSASSYTSLKLERVELAAVWNQREWQQWKLPAAVVISSSVRYGAGRHGDGDAHFDKLYPVVLLVLTQGTQAQAILDAQTLLKRLERLVAELAVEHDLAADTNGERLADIQVRTADMTAVAVPDSNDSWTVIGGLGVDFESET